jgi:hypothetical protein
MLVWLLLIGALLVAFGGGWLAWWWIGRRQSTADVGGEPLPPITGRGDAKLPSLTTSGSGIGIVLHRTRTFLRRHPWSIAVGGALTVVGYAAGFVDPVLGAVLTAAAYFAGIIYPLATRYVEPLEDQNPPLTSGER